MSKKSEAQKMLETLGWGGYILDKQKRYLTEKGLTEKARELDKRLEKIKIKKDTLNQEWQKRRMDNENSKKQNVQIVKIEEVSISRENNVRIDNTERVDASQEKDSNLQELPAAKYPAVDLITQTSFIEELIEVRNSNQDIAIYEQEKPDEKLDVLQIQRDTSLLNEQEMEQSFDANLSFNNVIGKLVENVPSTISVFLPEPSKENQQHFEVVGNLISEYNALKAKLEIAENEVREKEARYIEKTQVLENKVQNLQKEKQLLESQIQKSLKEDQSQEQHISKKIDVVANMSFENISDIGSADIISLHTISKPSALGLEDDSFFSKEQPPRKDSDLNPNNKSGESGPNFFYMIKRNSSDNTEVQEPEVISPHFPNDHERKISTMGNFYLQSVANPEHNHRYLENEVTVAGQVPQNTDL